MKHEGLEKFGDWKEAGEIGQFLVFRRVWEAVMDDMMAKKH